MIFLLFATLPPNPNRILTYTSLQDIRPPNANLQFFNQTSFILIDLEKWISSVARYVIMEKLRIYLQHVRYIDSLPPSIHPITCSPNKPGNYL